MQLPQDPTGYQRTDHLRSAVVYLVAWVGVAIAAYRIFRDRGGLRETFSQATEQPLPMLLVVASVVLLAFAIRSFSLHFRNSPRAGNQDT